MEDENTQCQQQGRESLMNLKVIFLLSCGTRLKAGIRKKKGPKETPLKTSDLKQLLILRSCLLGADTRVRNRAGTCHVLCDLMSPRTASGTERVSQEQGAAHKSISWSNLWSSSAWHKCTFPEWLLTVHYPLSSSQRESCLQRSASKCVGPDRGAVCVRMPGDSLAAPSPQLDQGPQRGMVTLQQTGASARARLSQLCHPNGNLWKAIRWTSPPLHIRIPWSPKPNTNTQKHRITFCQETPYLTPFRIF